MPCALGRQEQLAAWRQNPQFSGDEVTPEAHGCSLELALLNSQGIIQSEFTVTNGLQAGDWLHPARGFIRNEMKRKKK